MVNFYALKRQIRLDTLSEVVSNAFDAPNFVRYTAQTSFLQLCLWLERVAPHIVTLKVTASPTLIAKLLLQPC